MPCSSRRINAFDESSVLAPVEKTHKNQCVCINSLSTSNMHLYYYKVTFILITCLQHNYANGIPDKKPANDHYIELKEMSENPDPPLPSSAVQTIDDSVMVQVSQK